jgi:hypothetical protein
VNQGTKAAYEGSRGGPKTAEGRGRSSSNALKHGALSLRPVVGVQESVEAWESHLAGVFRAFVPRVIWRQPWRSE